jgi:hypothetical protein
VEAAPPQSSRAERSTGMLALGSWLVLATAILPGLVSDPLDFTIWHWLIFASAVLGLVGGALWAASHPRWRRVVLAAACSYLIVIIARFLAVSVWWQLDFVPVSGALRLAFWMKGQELMHPFSQYRVLEGLGRTFYEALMPTLQLIVLLGLASTRRR